jgi:pyruvate kinase
MRKTKIIATLGPATASYGSIVKLIKAGVNVFRLNFSHGDLKFFTKIIAMINKARNKLDVPVAIMQDLQGPKIRVAGLEAAVNVKRGDVLKVKSQKSKVKSKTKTKNKIQNESGSINVDFKDLHKYVKPGQKILINDGMVQLRVDAIKNKEIICKVTAGGEIAPRKGVNLPGIKLPVPSLTARDRKNLRFGLKNKVDIVCLSFVRDAGDMKALNSMIRSKGHRPLVIAKIEKPEALKQINSILDSSDGVMVARGDLAVEAGYRIIPEAQKDIIKKANAKGKLAIVATQMLESMINNPFPERAEITDVYNAVLDGADALMLSGETSVGKYPEKTVRTMSGIIKEAEKKHEEARKIPEYIRSGDDYENMFSYAAAKTAERLAGPVIAVRVLKPEDIQFISDYRPANPVVALVENAGMFKKMSVYHGAHPVLAGKTPEGALAVIKKIFPQAKNVVYVDFLARGRARGELLVFKIR